MGIEIVSHKDSEEQPEIMDHIIAYEEMKVFNSMMPILRTFQDLCICIFICIYIFVYIPLSIFIIHTYTYILTCDNEEQKYLYDFLIVISRFTLNYFQIPKSFNLVAKLRYIKPKGVIIAACCMNQVMLL